MKALKSIYVESMHRLATLGPAERLSEVAAARDPYSWRRWAASLLAIYDTQRMIRLDCPWWNVAATARVEAFLAARPDARVFEWGAGASTVWLGRRAAEVVSVEHDLGWFKKFRASVSDLANVSLTYRTLGADGAAYIDALEEAGGSFDLIVIDGRYRARCLSRAKRRLAPGGLILFDDSGRARYRAAIETSGLAEARHFGRSYCVPYPDHTSLLTADG